MQVQYLVRDFCSQNAQRSEFVAYIQRFYEPKIGTGKPMLLVGIGCLPAALCDLLYYSDVVHVM